MLTFDYEGDPPRGPMVAQMTGPYRELERDYNGLKKHFGINEVYVKGFMNWVKDRQSNSYDYMTGRIKDKKRPWGDWYHGLYAGEFDVTGRPVVTPASRLSVIIQSRMAPAVHTGRREFLRPTTDVRELRARETMKRVLGEEEHRRFLRHGFISIQGKSGLTYQIFPGHKVTCVFDGGELVERLCVILKGQFCPTDSLMMRYLMILNDEEQFRSFAIKHGIQLMKYGASKTVDRETSLNELFRKLKAA